MFSSACEMKLMHRASSAPSFLKTQLCFLLGFDWLKLINHHKTQQTYAAIPREQLWEISPNHFDPGHNGINSFKATKNVI